MRWFTKWVGVLLLALWVPATLHCQLETLLDLAFLSCCQHVGAEQTTPHHEADCSTDGCATVESGLYKNEQRRDTVAAPILATVHRLGSALEPETHPDRLAAPLATLAPPELTTAWHFDSRAALPVRAPSFAA